MLEMGTSGLMSGAGKTGRRFGVSARSQPRLYAEGVGPDRFEDLVASSRTLGLFLICFVCLSRCILGFGGGMILIVASHCFRDLFRGEFAVIFRMQYFSQLTRIHFHDCNSSFDSLEIDIWPSDIDVEL